jgi:hypothetical protein
MSKVKQNDRSLSISFAGLMGNSYQNMDKGLFFVNRVNHFDNVVS